MKKRLQKTKEENYKYYKKETIDAIMYSIFSKGEKYDYYSDKTPFIENDYKEKFCNYIIEEVIKKHPTLYEKMLFMIKIITQEVSTDEKLKRQSSESTIYKYNIISTKTFNDIIISHNSSKEKDDFSIIFFYSNDALM